MPEELLLPLGMTLRQIALALRRVVRDRSFSAVVDHRKITLTAWPMIAAAVKKLERDAYNDGVEDAARISDVWGGVSSRIRKLKR